MIGYIYMTTNKINNKKYIGRRCGKSDESYLGSGSYFVRAVKKYGRKNFIKIILEDNITDMERLYEREIFYIKKFNAVKSKMFYNISPGGADRINNLDAKSLEKINKKRIGKKASQKTIEKLKKSHENQTNENLRKGVLQYDLNWNFIKEYESLSEAARQNNILAGSSSQLTKACRFETPVRGFYWRYKDKDFKPKELPESINTSNFRGVSFNKVTCKFQANINYKRKKYYLGSFNTPEEAYDVYCKRARELYGDCTKTTPYNINKPKSTKK